jgi:hypothetical protein
MISGKSTGHSSENTIGLSVSIALHLLFVIALLMGRQRHFPAPTVIDVTVELPPGKSPKKEIISPSDTKSLRPPEQTNRLSDDNSIAVKEQVRRGDNGGLPGKPSERPGERSSQQPEQKPSKEPQKPQAPENQPQTKAHPQEKEPPSKVVRESPQKAPPLKHLALKDLKLDDATLSERFGAPPAKQLPSQNPTTSQSNLSSYSAFSRPPGSGAAFLGTAGISDHLPNLPDGDITLLNAKANTFAGFVRRVAIQVFTQLRTQGWEQLSRYEIAQLQDFTTIEAILSPDGKFVTMNLLDGSGSLPFDSVVKLSVRAGAQDPNPPEGARASDGRIHFIFKARSWASSSISPRSGAPVEHRWILLATGLE